MRNTIYICALALLTCGILPAATLNVDAGTPLGGDWVDGYVLISAGVGPFTTPSDPSGSPFNEFLGADTDSGSNFSANWSMDFSPALLGVAPTVNSASLMLGLFDHDSAASGDQVASFVFGGVDLTAELNALLEASGGGEFEYNIYTLTLPSTVYAALLSGNVSAALSLNGPGQTSPIGFPEFATETAFNGAGLDFAKLSIEYTNDTTPTEPVPEPGTMVLLSAGLGLMGLSLRKHVRRT